MYEKYTFNLCLVILDVRILEESKNWLAKELNEDE